MQDHVAIKSALCGLTLGLVGCLSAPAGSSSVPPPIPPGGGAPLLTDKEVALARKLYINKCARCHKFYDPAAYDKAAWQDWMTKMSHKARLKSPQEELLSKYLEIYRVGGQSDEAAGP